MIINSLVTAVFAIAGIVLGVTCTFSAFLILIYGKTKLHRTLILFNVAVAWWGYGAFFITQAFYDNLSIIYWRVAFVGVIFISILFYHTICLFCEISRKVILRLAYLQGFFFLILNTTNYYISKVFFLKNSFYYLKATGMYFVASFAIWLILVTLGLFELVVHFKKFQGIKRTQALYLFLGFGTGFLGGTTNFFPMFGIDILPWGNITIPIYSLILTYALLRYKLLDFRLIVTRIGIFIFVYLMVLGIPFILGIKYFGLGVWIIPTGVCAFLATICPFIFIFIQKKAEDALLREDRRINLLLTQASYGMTTTLRELPKLLHLIVDILRKILRVEKVQVFILNQAINEYEVKESSKQDGLIVVRGESPLIQDLMNRRAPLVWDELKAQTESDANEMAINNILIEMNKISCNIIVPIAIDSNLLGFIALSDRKGKESYSAELLNVLGVLGNQAALAIKNCYFLEEETARMEKLGLEERRISLDHLTASMAHEIDNPMGVILGHSERLQEGLQDLRISMPQDLREDLNKSLDYILEARRRVSAMIKAIKEYSGSVRHLEPVSIAEVEHSYWTLFGHKFKSQENREVKYIREIEENLPFILGDKIQLEEVLFNLANNSLHAVRKSDTKEIKLRMFQKDEDFIRIEYSDTGYGIEKEIINDIFLAHVTTKGSTEGSGLGLYRVRKIIELHNARIWAESEGKFKGAKFIIEIPIFKGDLSVYRNKTEQNINPQQLF